MERRLVWVLKTTKYGKNQCFTHPPITFVLLYRYSSNFHTFFVLFGSWFCQKMSCLAPVEQKLWRLQRRLVFITWLTKLPRILCSLRHQKAYSPPGFDPIGLKIWENHYQGLFNKTHWAEIQNRGVCTCLGCCHKLLIGDIKIRAIITLYLYSFDARCLYEF